MSTSIPKCWKEVLWLLKLTNCDVIIATFTRFDWDNFCSGCGFQNDVAGWSRHAGLSFDLYYCVPYKIYAPIADSLPVSSIFCRCQIRAILDLAKHDNKLLRHQLRRQEYHVWEYVAGKLIFKFYPISGNGETGRLIDKKSEVIYRWTSIPRTPNSDRHVFSA